MKYSMIVAVSSNNGIGYKGSLPWYLKEDLRHFSALTKGNGNNAIIMGNKTWESISKRPLPGRKNYILTRQKSLYSQSILPSVRAAMKMKTLVCCSKCKNKMQPQTGDPQCRCPYCHSVLVGPSGSQRLQQRFPKYYNDMEELHKHCIEQKYDYVWIIGGSEIYKEYLNRNWIDELHITRIQKEYVCDTFLPPIAANLVLKEKGLLFSKKYNYEVTDTAPEAIYEVWTINTSE